MKKLFVLIALLALSVPAFAEEYRSKTIVYTPYPAGSDRCIADDTESVILKNFRIDSGSSAGYVTFSTNGMGSYSYPLIQEKGVAGEWANFYGVERRFDYGLCIDPDSNVDRIILEVQKV